MSESESPTTVIEGAHSAGPTPDSALPGWLASLPVALRPYAQLSRLDRPVGIWLLFLPCLIGLAFARIGEGLQWIDLWWALLFAIGAVAMRGAGCTWNDMTDAEMDAGVARTAARPIPSGRVSKTQAGIWLGAQLFIGFLVWLCLPWDAKIVALLAIPLVIAYPYMKRLTWWPQAWLGFTFNWGILVAAATAGYVSFLSIILLIGMAMWTIAYDTIYALQDREDDALIGVKSTARLFGDRAVLGAFVFHLIGAAIILFAAWATGAGRIGALTLMAFLGHGIWQAMNLNREKSRNALEVFKSNVWAGVILAAGFTVAALLSGGGKQDVQAKAPDASAWAVMTTIIEGQQAIRDNFLSERKGERDILTPAPESPAKPLNPFADWPEPPTEAERNPPPDEPKISSGPIPSWVPGID